MYQASFVILLIIILTIIGFGFNRAAVNAQYSDDKRKKFLRGYITLITFFVAYVCVVSMSGILADFSLPPRFPIFLILPAFSIIIWFYRSKKFRDIIKNFPTALAVYYQSFRIFVELLIHGLAVREIGPYLITFEGYNFEILAGLTAPIIGYLAYTRKVLSHKAVIAWNIGGLSLLAIIVFLFLSSAVAPHIWGFDKVPFTFEITEVPYTFIASVYMPSAVFMHVMSIKKSLQALKAC